MSLRDENYQPKTVIWREANFEVHLQQVLGVLDYDNNFDNTFQKWKLVMQLVYEVIEAIKQDVIPLQSKNRLDLLPNKDAIRKMDKIWNGQTFFASYKES